MHVKARFDSTSGKDPCGPEESSTVRQVFIPLDLDLDHFKLVDIRTFQHTPNINMANAPNPKANALVPADMPKELLELMGKFMVLGDTFILTDTENIKKPTHTPNALINFTTQYLHALSHGGNGVWAKMYNQYRRVAEAFLINSAPHIIVEIKDFDFANLKKFFMLLQSRGRFQHYQHNPAAPATRRLEIR